MSRRVWWILGVAGIAALVAIGTAVVRDLNRTMAEARTMAGAASLAAAAEGRMGELLEGVAPLLAVGERPQCLEPTEYDAVTALLRKTGLLDDPNQGTSAFRDAWGQRYQIWMIRKAGAPRPHVQEVRSAGPDGRFGTEDDLVR